MFGRLVQKELMDHVLDFRFLAVFALSALLTALSLYVASRNYASQLREYNETAENHRAALQSYIDQGNLNDFKGWGGGYRWNRRPAVLSPVVYGLSGNLGQEAVIQSARLPKFEASLFETDPIYALFGVLDLAFIVKVVLSLCVLLFTYDAICGEKEEGTLSLYLSFPVARSTVALAKLVGSTLAVLVPLLFAFLLAATVLALSPDVGLQGDDWLRMVALMGVFGLYLGVFAGFGLWASALTHRRMTAFLSLMGLWALWIFVAPDVAVRTGRKVTPVDSFVELYKRAESLEGEIEKERREDFQQYLREHPSSRSWTPPVEMPKDWKAMSGAEKKAYQEKVQKAWEAVPEEKKAVIQQAQMKAFEDANKAVSEKWSGVYASRTVRLQEARHNQMRQQYQVVTLLSTISPFGAVTSASMDLARTGFVQQARLEGALYLHYGYFERFLDQKARQVPLGRPTQEGIDFTDLTPFTYQDNETVGECLSRNIFHILNLALLAALGFIGAYVAILRYDVR